MKEILNNKTKEKQLVKKSDFSGSWITLILARR